MDKCLNKTAGIGDAARDLFMKMYAKKMPGGYDRPMSEDTARLTRAAQGDAIRNILNLMMGGAAVGGGIGLAQQLPKLFKAKADVSTADPIDSTESVVKRSEVTPEWTNVRLGPLPEGWAIPATAFGTAGAVMGADKLVDWLTDKARAKMVADRKNKLKAEFERMMSADINKKSAACVMVDELASTYEKSAFGWAELKGSAGTLAALVALMSAAGGYGLSAKMDPLAPRKKALELMLKKRKLMSPVGVSPDMGAPISEREEPIDPAMDLSKIGAQADFNGRTSALVDVLMKRAFDWSNPISSVGSALGRASVEIPEAISNAKKTYADVSSGASKVRQLTNAVSPEDLSGTIKDVRGTLGDLRGMVNEARPGIQSFSNAGKELTGLIQGAKDTWGKVTGGFQRGVQGLGQFLTAVPGMLGQAGSAIGGMMGGQGQSQVPAQPQVPAAAEGTAGAAKAVATGNAPEPVRTGPLPSTVGAAHDNANVSTDLQRLSESTRKLGS